MRPTIGEQLVDLRPAPVADFTIVGARLAVEASHENVIDLVLDQIVRELDAILEGEGWRQVAFDPHLLAQSTVGGAGSRLARSGMTTAGVRPQPGREIG